MHFHLEKKISQLYELRTVTLYPGFSFTLLGSRGPRLERLGKSRFGASEGEASELDLGESHPNASPLCNWVGSGWAALERAQARRMGGGAGNLDASLSLSSDFVCPLRWVLRGSTFLVLVEEARRVRSLRAPEKGREREWTGRSRAGAGPGRRRVLIYSRCRGQAAQRRDCSPRPLPRVSVSTCPRRAGPAPLPPQPPVSAGSPKSAGRMRSGSHSCGLPFPRLWCPDCTAAAPRVAALRTHASRCGCGSKLCHDP